MTMFPFDFDDAFPDDETHDAFQEDFHALPPKRFLSIDDDYFYENVIENNVWVDRFDNVTPIPDLDDDHLENIVKFLEREPSFFNKRKIIKKLTGEISKRKSKGKWNPCKANQIENFMKQEDDDMSNNGFNMKNVTALVRDDITTINVVHEGTSRVYTYKCLKTLAKELEEEDKVLVKNERGVTVGEVVKVHREPEIDIYGTPVTAWAFQKVKLDEVEELEKDDRLIEKRISKLQARSARDQALAALGISSDQTSGLLEKIREEEDDII